MEKKILAISEDEFKTIIAGVAGKHILNGNRSIQACLTMFKEDFSKLLGDICADIHMDLFSDKYVIGTKGKTAEAECFNRRIKKSTNIILSQKQEFVKEELKNDIQKFRQAWNRKRIRPKPGKRNGTGLPGQVR